LPANVPYRHTGNVLRIILFSLKRNKFDDQRTYAPHNICVTEQ
jgi:hypothetical protein